MRTPYVNASLMHEVRMIAMVALPALIPVVKKIADSRNSVSGLMCSRCLRLKTQKPKKAITIWNGNALCEQHSTVTVA